MCPFNKTSCGGNNTIDFQGDSVGEKKVINITLPTGETCQFKVKAKCGLPAFEPLNETTGFDIQIVDYDEDDLDTANSARLLQAVPPANGDGKGKEKNLKTKAANATRIEGSKPPKGQKGPI